MKTKEERKRESKELIDNLKTFVDHRHSERGRRGKISNYIQVLLKRIEALESEIERKPRGRPKKVNK
jgi:hypothetical protein